MKCPKCGFENPEGSKFCNQCGASLTMVEASIPAKGISTGLKRDKILDIEGERKNITVLFADISGFTTMSEKLDPEDVQGILNTVFDIVSGLSEKYGGTIDKFIGDEAMILFGAPIATENHIERSIRCALEIKKTLEKMKDKFPVRIQMHMGIHTGEVVLGEIGGEIIKDTTVIGDTVNLASRLESLAPGGEIFASGDVAKKADAFTNMVFVMNTAVKGKSIPIEVYRIVDIKKERGRIRGIEGVSAPMIGRKQEIEDLINIYYKVIENRKMRVVVIEGEAGIGKSRLYNEFVNRIGEVPKFQARFLPFAQEPDFPMKTILRQYFDIKRDFTSQVAMDYIKNKIRDIDVLPADASVVIGKFLSLISDEEDKDPQKSREELLFILEQILRAETKKILIIGIEDLHWAERSSLETFEYLIKFLEDIPIMFVFMTRPTHEFPDVEIWLKRILSLDKSFRIMLSALSLEESKTLISKLLDIEQLPLDLKKRIIEKGGGNPLFIEEILKSLMEKGYIYNDNGHFKAKSNINEFEVPDTIGDIVLSRVDALSLNNKKVIQSASIIGRVFWDKPLDGLMSLKTEEILQTLRHKDFIRKRNISSFEDASEYMFKHILLQEAIYRSVLKRIRKKTHRDFAFWLVKNYPEKKMRFATLLAFHFEKGGDFENAIQYYKISGDLYVKQFATQEAIDAYRKALILIKQYHIKEELLWEIYDRLGRQYSALGMFNEAKESFEKALLYAKESNKKGQVKYDYAVALQRISHYTEAIEMLEEALEEIGKQDKEMLLSIYYEFVWINYLKGESDKASYWLEKMIMLTENLGENMSQNEAEKKWADVFEMSAMLKDYHREIRGAIDDYEMALDIYKRDNNIGGISAVYNNLAGLYLQMGWFTMAINMYKDSVELSRKMGNRLGVAISLYNLGETYAFLNVLKDAESYFQEYLSLNKLIDNELGNGYGNMGLAEIYTRREEYEKALQHIDKSINIFDKLGSKFMKFTALVMKASILLKSGRTKGVDILLKNAFDYAEKTKNKGLIADVYLNKGKYFLEEGRLKDSVSSLKKAEEIFKSIGDIQMFYDLYIAMIHLYIMRGDTSLVKTYQKRLKGWTERVLAGIKDKEIQKKFLDNPELQKVLD